MRSKLTLNLDQLSVDSFETSPAERQKGTVFAEQQCTCYTNCTCPGCPTCDATCPATCYNTCDDRTCGASCNGTCNCGTDYTDCGGCGGDTCLQTACGPYFCCA